MSYKVITPTGTLTVDTAREAKEYQTLYGYPYRKSTADEDYETFLRDDELDTDGFGNCFSDADPGL